MSSSDAPEPISVKATSAPIVTQESAKVLLVAGLSAAAAILVHNDLALAAVLPAVGVLATLLLSIWQRVENWKVMKLLANLLPDDVAVVGKPK